MGIVSQSWKNSWQTQGMHEITVKGVGTPGTYNLRINSFPFCPLSSTLVPFLGFYMVYCHLRLKSWVLILWSVQFVIQGSESVLLHYFDFATQCCRHLCLSFIFFIQSMGQLVTHKAFAIWYLSLCHKDSSARCWISALLSVILWGFGEHMHNFLAIMRMKRGPAGIIHNFSLLTYSMLTV